MHLWIICELQIVIINTGSEIGSIIGSFQLSAIGYQLIHTAFLSLTNK
jgi:hypothetical protein